MSDIQTEYLEGRIVELSGENGKLKARVRDLEGAIRNHDEIHAHFGGLYADQVLREELGEGEGLRPICCEECGKSTSNESECYGSGGRRLCENCFEDQLA